MTYFFVGGSQRAGTTLLQSILCSDDTTSPLLQEAMYFRSMISTYQLGKTILTTKLKDYFSSLEELRNFNASWVKAFLEHTLHRFAPIKHLVLKEPHLTMLFPEIYELISGAKFLIIVRDPRDTIASMIEVGERLASQGYQDIFTTMFTTRDLKQLCNHYKSFYAPSIHYQIPDFQQQVLYIKYELLVENPLVQIDRIKSFTNLTLNKFNQNATWQRSKIDFSATSPDYNPWYTELYGKPISANQINRYRQVLTESEISIIEQECADAFQIFGY
ncbi:sulfotransferase [Aerosakkonemataceae cyanobacterium BLCC-F154]|uniref:Sulfotransferase n=1 Tax=Floridaenema fluviatile BLCC-F154 TaxID=3153640 RepID=A0ABV4YHJ7_9CYAN